VSQFESYESVQQPDHSTRVALPRIADRAAQKRQRADVFVNNFVNNRLEGNAAATIEAVVSAART